jgi:glycosyltransferase involved in cell wall biosynthesis
MRKTVFLDTCHTGAIGGGENYLMRFAIELGKHADVYVRQNWDYQFYVANGFWQLFPVFEGKFKPDIHIQCNHNDIKHPIGKYNVIVTFFPKQTLSASYSNFINLIDEVITICDYSAKYVGMYWFKKSTILYPSIDTTQYYVTDKKNQIVSIGHFFQEFDGHSKNQHILIEALRQLSNYRLVLIGNVYSNDVEYLHKCQNMCSGLDVEFVLNCSAERVRNILAESKFLWHANGYGRINPAQTEHFGIIALEALASNCIPFVHDSGGCRDIQGVVTWLSIRDLVENTKLLSGDTTAPLSAFPEQYTLPHFKSEVEKWISKF